MFAVKHVKRTFQPWPDPRWGKLGRLEVPTVSTLPKFRSSLDWVQKNWKQRLRCQGVLLQGSYYEVSLALVGVVSLAFFYYTI
jgi:hypothetical protein